MLKADRIALVKIIKYCDDIAALLNQFDTSFERYQQEIAFQYACNMCIIQIGELVARLSDVFIRTHPDIPWRAIKGMRNLHAHDYDSVKLEIVWETLIHEIPDLRSKIEELMK